MTSKITQREVEALSAYIDGQLSQNERTRLEKELQGRADLRALLEDLQRTHQLLASQPVMRAPRNFTLTPQMAGVRSSQPAIGRLAPAMSFASVVAAVLFIMVLAGDMLSSRNLLPIGQVSSQPVSMAVEKEAPAAAEMEALDTSLQEAAAPPAEAPVAAAPMVETRVVEATPTPEAAFLTEAYPALGANPTDGITSAREISPTVQAPALAMQITPTAQAESLPIEEPTQEAALQADLVGEEPAQPAAEQESQAVQPGRIGWLWLEIILALLAVFWGVLAYLMYRSRRA